MWFLHWYVHTFERFIYVGKFKRKISYFLVFVAAAELTHVMCKTSCAFPNAGERKPQENSYVCIHTYMYIWSDCYRRCLFALRWKRGRGVFFCICLCLFMYFFFSFHVRAQKMASRCRGAKYAEIYLSKNSQLESSRFIAPFFICSP